MASPAFQNATTATRTTNATTTTINKPASTASGDFLLLIGANDGTATSFTAPTGFTTVIVTSPGGTPAMMIAYRFADGSEGSSFTINHASEQGCFSLSRWTGVDTTRPINGLGLSFAEADPEGLFGFCPSIYSSCTDGVAIRFCGTDNIATITDPSGVTNICTLTTASTGSTSLSVAYDNISGTGYTGRKNFTTSVAEQVFGGTLILNSSHTDSFPLQPVILSYNRVVPLNSLAMVIDKPVLTASGDGLILAASSDITTTLLVPSGFTSKQSDNASSQIFAQVSERICDGSEASTFTVTNAGANSQFAHLFRIGHWDGTTLTDTSSKANSGVSPSTTPTGSSITPSVNNCLVLAFMANDDDDAKADNGYPSGYTGYDSMSTTQGSDSGFGVAYLAQTTAGATGTATWTLDLSEDWVVINLAIKAVPAGSNTQQSCPATAVAVATCVRKVKKNIVCTEVSIATCTRKTKKNIAATSVAIATCRKKAKKILAATALAVGTIATRFIYHVAIAATAVAVATTTIKMRWARNLAATVVAVATTTRKTKKVLAATSLAVPTCVRKTKKAIAATALAVATTIRKTKKILAATALAVATSSARKVVLVALAATAQAVATITARPTFRAALAATAQAVPTIKKKCKKVLAATSLAIATIVKKTKKPLAATVVAVATESDRAAFKRTLSVQVGAVATSSQNFHAGTPTAVQDLISLFIAFKR